MDDLARHLDFANHKATATPSDIHKLCAAVETHNFHTAFVNPVYVALAKSILGARAKVGCVISFPLGADTTDVKMAAANKAVSDGADELDVVPNLGLYFSGDKQAFIADMTSVVESARMFGKPVIVKFILDPGYFDTLPDKKDAMQEAAMCIRQSGADFVKIGSGMGPRNPTTDDVMIIKEAVPDMKIKVAGGVDTKEKALKLFNAGADRIGTSRAPEIIGAVDQPTKKSASSEE